MRETKLGIFVTSWPLDEFLNGIVRHGYFARKFNRLCGFVTSDISYHCVTPIKCPPGVVCQSFATYSYTQEAPIVGKGDKHSTIFKPRPDDFVKAYIKMPFEKFKRKAVSKAREFKKASKMMYVIITY